jgi:hypothetical protein
MESMRSPFLEESRIVVVLYREPWGKTPWTGVEDTAIQERCLKDGFRSLFFMMLDNSTPPRWLPHTHVRFNYANFGLQEAVGAIKARVLDFGGTITPLTPLNRIEHYEKERQYRQERHEFRSRVASAILMRKTSELFRVIEMWCAEINNRENLLIEFRSEPTQCHLRATVSLLVDLSYRSGEASTVSDRELIVREYSNKLPFRGESFRYPDGKPRQLSEGKFLPEMSRAREYGWTKDEAGERSVFLSSETLASQIAIQFIDLVEKATRGDFGYFPWPPT